MFPDDFLVRETNQNAQQSIKKKPDPRRYATTCEEMNAFAASIIIVP